mgnify:CR=1 FL=1
MIIKKQWGSEEVIANNDLYCAKYMLLAKQCRCSYHYHKVKDETFYIVVGEVLMVIEGSQKVMRPGDSVRIMPKQKHSFTGLEHSQILEVSTHDEADDSYRDDKSRRLDDDEFGQITVLR